MRLIFKILISLAIISFIVIQFFQPEKNISDNSQNHIFNQEQLPENVQKIINTSCMDCHSNNTNYLWYHNIAPVSWLVRKHITEGKKELNFSEWSKLDKYKKITALEDIRQELEQNTMPIKPYLLMHPDAKITDEDKAVMYAWIDKKGTELVKSSVEQ